MNITLLNEREDMFLSSCECISNANNSVGVMGAGLAKAFLLRFPIECQLFNRDSIEFQRDKKELALMPPKLYKTLDNLLPSHLLMFPTKIHWKPPSRYEYIQTNMPLAVELLNQQGIKSVAFPKLGCGLGGLDFQSVYKIMEEALTSFKGDQVEIYV